MPLALEKKNILSESEFFIPFTSHSINIINLMKLNLLQTVSIYENVRTIYVMKESKL
jgi:hypothetical protein